MPVRMTSRERLLAAIRHEQPDRVPIAPRNWAFILGKYGNCDLETTIKAHKEYGWDNYQHIESFTPNFIKNSTAQDYSALEDVKVEVKKEHEQNITTIRRTFHTPAGKLTDLIRQPDSGGEYGVSPSPHRVEYLIKDKADLEKLRYLIPDPAKHSSTKKYSHTLKAIGDTGLVVPIVNSALDFKGCDAFPIEDLMMKYYDDPEFLRKLLDIFHQGVLQEITAMLEAGVEIIHISWHRASLSSGWSLEMYKELFLPQVKETVDLVHSGGALYNYYDDGPLMKIAPLLKQAG